MSDETPPAKKGRMPPEEHRFKKGHSGNPNGRPRRQRRGANGGRGQISDILDRIANTEVPIEENGIVRLVPYNEVLCNGIAGASLQDYKLGMRFLGLLLKEGQNASASKPDGAEEEDPLSNPIVQREIQREVRRRLFQKGQAEQAKALMKEEFEPDDEEGRDEDEEKDNP